ncbi:MAG: aldo/keto reductase, partial [Calditrichaeota bacterium]|nr:aldo/keto reductase [Calditrichota bacterium]
AKYGKTPGQLAVAWVLRQDIVTSAIVGGRSPDQVKENIGGTGWKIAEEDLQAIDKILAERIRRIKEVGGTVRE